jgi:transposase
MGISEGHQKSIYNTPKVKKNKDTYGIYPTKFTSSTQKHKKVIKTPNQPIEIKKISNKSMLSTSKVKRRQKFIWGLPDGVCRLNPKSLKNYQNTKSTNQDEHFFKKICLVP